MLNPLVLLDPSVGLVAGGVFLGVSVLLSIIISSKLFKSYHFSGLGYLLGMPAGFAFLGASYACEQASFLLRADPVLYPTLYWVQLVLQAEALALISVSYIYKNAGKEQDIMAPAMLGGNLIINIRLMLTLVPISIVAIPLIVPTSVLIAGPYFNYPMFADLNFYLRIFNMLILAYILKSTLVSLVKAGNFRLLYIPAAFALLWLEQYSLIITYFDNSTAAFVGSAMVRLAALGLFTYVMLTATSRRRIEIEARKTA